MYRVCRVYIVHVYMSLTAFGQEKMVNNMLTACSHDFVCQINNFSFFSAQSVM